MTTGGTRLLLALAGLTLGGCEAALDVPPPPAPAIALNIGTSAFAVRVGEASPRINVTLSRNSTALGPVQLSVSGLPSGVRPTISPSTLTGATLTATLEVLATATATPGSSTLTVRAEGTGVLAQATVALTVQPAP